MQTLEQIENDVKQLNKADQEALRDWLENLLEDGMELKDEFRAEINRGEHDILEGRGRRVEPGRRLEDFFEKWDASHSVKVGEKPNRASTYGDNPRLR